MRLCLAVLAVCLSTVSAAPTVDRELDGHWQQWKEWHNKDYHEVSALFVPKHLLFFNLHVLWTDLITSSPCRRKKDGGEWSGRRT